MESRFAVVQKITSLVVALKNVCIVDQEEQFPRFTTERISTFNTVWLGKDEYCGTLNDVEFGLPIFDELFETLVELLVPKGVLSGGVHRGVYYYIDHEKKFFLKVPIHHIKRVETFDEDYSKYAFQILIKDETNGKATICLNDFLSKESAFGVISALSGLMMNNK